MEKKKEKKVIKEIKEKKTKVIKKENTNNKMIINDTKKIIRFVAYLTTFFASIFAIIIFVFGLISTFSVANKEQEAALHDNFTMTFISKVSNCTLEETKLGLMAADSKAVYVIFNIILPTIALVCASILLILLCSLILKFISTTTCGKDLFTKTKLQQVENIVNIMSVIVFICWILFNNPSMPFTMLIFILLYVIYYLFKICVYKYEQKN